MSDTETTQQADMDPDTLFREETFTDRRVGSITRMTPVDRQGETDPARPVRYVGQTQILTPMGAVPISFEIEAASLGEAAQGFGAAAARAVEETIEKASELRRQTAGSIIVPEAGADGLGGPGNLPGGGKIQIP